jgi:hypothetical protein
LRPLLLLRHLLLLLQLLLEVVSCQRCLVDF